MMTALRSESLGSTGHNMMIMGELQYGYTRSDASWQSPHSMVKDPTPQFFVFTYYLHLYPGAATPQAKDLEAAPRKDHQSLGTEEVLDYSSLSSEVV
jgi:hypothetical protein